MNYAVTISTGLLVGAVGGCALMWTLTFFRERRGPRQQRHTTFLFSGNLKQTSIVDAIQFLEIGKREGILHIYCGRRKGYITFSRGRVIDAFYRNKTAREAMFAMLDLEEGDFYFEPKAISQPQLISESIMDLVLEWDAEKNRS